MFKTYTVISYNQFMLFDKGGSSPAYEWTEKHFNQGFARGPAGTAIRTLLDSGEANVVVQVAPPPPDWAIEFERVIAVPLEVPSGELAICAPDEYPIPRSIPIEPGHYRATIGQREIGEDDWEDILIYLEKLDHPIHESEIMVADGQLSPEYPLMESAEHPEV